jgi:streptogramin lyase
MKRPTFATLTMMAVLLGTASVPSATVGAATLGHGDLVAFALQSSGQPAELTIGNAANGRVRSQQQMPPSQNGNEDSIAIVASPATKLVYAIEENASGIVFAMDPRTGAATNFFTLPNGDFTGAIALSQDGMTLYVGGESDDYVVNAATGALEASAAGLGGFTLGYHLLVASPTRNELYEIEGGGYDVFDAKTFAFEYDVSLPEFPMAGAVSSDGKLLYLADLTGYLDVVSVAGKKLVKRIALNSEADDIAFDPASQLIYLATGNGVTAISASTYATVASVGNIAEPYNLAVDPASHACFAASGTGLWRIDPTTFKAKNVHVTSGSITVQGVGPVY